MNNRTLNILGLVVAVISAPITFATNLHFLVVGTFILAMFCTWNLVDIYFDKKRKKEFEKRTAKMVENGTLTELQAKAFLDTVEDFR